VDAARSFAESLVELNAWHVQQSAACPKVRDLGGAATAISRVSSPKKISTVVSAPSKSTS
jgi:hypothetical protein